MSDEVNAAVSDAVAARVAEGRRSGRYTDELDAQLETQFHRSAVDPLTFPAFGALQESVRSLRAARLVRAAVEVSSSIPGGSSAHRFVAKVVGRQVDAVLRAAGDHATKVADTFDAVTASIDELRSLMTTEVFGDIDAVHYRVVSVEQRLARLEAAVASGVAPTEIASSGTGVADTI